MVEIISTDRSSVSLGYSSHSWQGVGRHGQCMKDAMMNTHGFIFPKHTVCTQLGQPDVEDVMALCLRKEGRARQREQENKILFVL